MSQLTLEIFSAWANFHEWVDVAQTVLLLVMAGAMAYSLYLFTTEVRRAGDVLREVVSNQAELQRNILRAWERIDAIEARLNGQPPQRSTDK